MTSYGPTGALFGPSRGPQTTRGALVLAAVALGVLFAASFPVAALLGVVAAVAGLAARRLARRTGGVSRSGGNGRGTVDGSPRRREPAD